MRKLQPGVVPKNLKAELDAISRRAFVPKLVVDIYKSTPAFSMLLRKPTWQERLKWQWLLFKWRWWERFEFRNAWHVLLGRVDIRDD